MGNMEIPTMQIRWHEAECQAPLLGRLIDRWGDPALGEGCAGHPLCDARPPRAASSYLPGWAMGISVPNLARLTLKKLLTLRTFMSWVNSRWLSSR